MYSEDVKIANKYANAQLSISCQKKIQRLIERDVFKVVISNNVDTPEKVLSSTKVSNSCFTNEIKDLCIDKTYQKCYLLVHTYNDGKKISY